MLNTIYMYFFLSLQMDGCLDCGHNKKHDIQTVLQICSRCYQRRVERKKTFQEIIETEVNYGRDLNILKEVCKFLTLFISYHIYHLN